MSLPCLPPLKPPPYPPHLHGLALSPPWAESLVLALSWATSLATSSWAGLHIAWPLNHIFMALPCLGTTSSWPSLPHLHGLQDGGSSLGLAFKKVVG